MPVRGLTFTSIGTGVSHTCGSTAEGEVYCWGTGNLLGAPSAATLDTNRLTCGLSIEGGEPCAHAPVRTELPAAARHLFVGPMMSCAALVTGELWCWGRLVGDAEATLAPREVTYPAEIVAVALGETHTCALSAAGEAYCLGFNSSGQLGSGTTSEFENEPRAVAGDLRFSSLSAGYATTCGLTAEGALYCWGDNQDGQLGTGDRQPRAAPVRVRLPD